MYIHGVAGSNPEVKVQLPEQHRTQHMCMCSCRCREMVAHTKSHSPVGQPPKLKQKMKRYPPPPPQKKKTLNPSHNSQGTTALRILFQYSVKLPTLWRLTLGMRSGGGVHFSFFWNYDPVTFPSPLNVWHPSPGTQSKTSYLFGKHWSKGNTPRLTCSPSFTSTVSNFWL